ncbi:hypothetical protein HHI36_009282 [Cryptolaemus montrouzieri]|uniref:Acyltransferase 3 domain-containing protein n=1 Tax=Cryptolaemus montrouzieri TaxID=559131 RepID=A0ABD2MV19_9CUCU
MMKEIIASLFLLVITINSGGSAITDKEYARLPPVFELDNFDRCMLLEDEALYCTMEFHLYPLNPKNTSKTWNQIQELKGDAKNYYHDRLRHGICVPFVCPNISTKHDDPQFKTQLANCYSKKYEQYGVYGTIGYMHCETNEPRVYDFLDIIVAIFVVFYIILIVYASFYEGLARYKSPQEYERLTSSTYGKFVSCFSIPRNWYRLKYVSDSPNVQTMKGIQGVRFYNMFLVILVHSCMMASIASVSNVKWCHKLLDSISSVFLASGPYGVETFFLISSLLLSHYIFTHFNEKSGRELNLKTLFRIFLYRYIRITSPLAVVLILHSTLLYHVGRGPWWEATLGRDREFCRENGWLNLLYVNNFVNPSRMCFIETWYTAVDMQAFILVLAILYFSVRKPERLWWIVPSVWLVVQGIHLKTIYERNISNPMSPTGENLFLLRALFEVDGLWVKVTASTFPNLVGSLVGLVAGFIFYKYENERIFTKKIHTVLWWIILGCGLSIVLFPGMWIFSKNFYPTYWFSLPYFAFNTTIYGISIAVFLFGVTKGVGWMAKWCVEWGPTYILGRISYSTFVVHYAYVVVKTSLKRGLEYIDQFSILGDALEVVVCSTILGLIMVLTVEQPTSALQSAFMEKRISTVTSKVINEQNASNKIDNSDEKEKNL